METSPAFAWVRCSTISLQLQLTLLGHTACLWQGDKLLIHGGENEHREYLSDVIVFDLKTAWWTQPKVRGPIPAGRARHAAAVHDDKLFILGGVAGSEPTTLDDICYLDLKTWTWSRAWSFVDRYDHSAWVWEGRMWVYGGIGPDMERNGDLWWLDLKSSPSFKSAPSYGTGEQSGSTQRGSSVSQSSYTPQHRGPSGSSGYAANSSSIQIRTPGHSGRPIAPGAISSVKFVSGPNIPVQASGTHFHVYSSGAMLDFVTPGEMSRLGDCSLSTLDLDSLQWQTLVNGPEIFDPGYRWSYCAMNEDGTKAWLLGSQDDYQGNDGAVSEYLSEILPIDLTKYGLLGNAASGTKRTTTATMPASDRHSSSPLAGLSADLGAMFDQPPESGMGSDFIITAEKEYDDDGDDLASSGPMVSDDRSSPVAFDAFLSGTTTSRPIHAHKLILQARWPHFARVYAAQMAEFHTRKMHIPEPYSVVRAFVYYLYTDSIAQHPVYCPGLHEVAGLLVMASIYDMPRLRLLCVHRLSRELDVDSAAIVWERAGVAGEEWLRRKAATFCLVHWGRVVRSEGFRLLNRDSLMELCEIIDVEGRVVGGEELEAIGGLGGGRIGGMTSSRAGGSRGRGSFTLSGGGVEEFEEEGDEEESMQLG
jgi:BTB/POZ domain/Galactose oxidase, central domain